jgi:hypothetical protein
MKKITTKKLDDLWSKIVKSDGKCELAGVDGYGPCAGPLNAHHIFGRRNFSVRWDLDNGICLCVSHHHFGRFSAEGSPTVFTNWLIQERGGEWHDDLKFKANQVVRNIDKEAVYKELLKATKL